MPLDHYISQVHLKNFYSEELGELMYAIRKQDQFTFTPNAKSICRIEDNSTNSYLREDRLIEEFLKEIEPKYNLAVADLNDDNINTDCIYVISGFIAYVISCSPAAMRIQSEPLKGTVEETSRILDKLKELPAPPPELGGENFTELFENGKIQVKIDPKYPQALGIASIMSRVSIFGNSRWEILFNSFEDNPFFTSDFPVVIEKTNDPRVLNRIVPLTPYIAVRIIPYITLERDGFDFSFSGFSYARKKLSRKDVSYINKLIIRCAETEVFYSNHYDWVPKLVQRNSGFHIAGSSKRIPFGNGTMLWSTQTICEIQ